MRYVYVFDSVYKSGYNRVVEPARVQPRIPKNPTFPSNKFNSKETPPSIGTIAIQLVEYIFLPLL